MKNRSVHYLLTALWLSLAVLLAGYVIAQNIGPTSIPQPLIVKNGPGIQFDHAVNNGISVVDAVTFSIRNSAPTAPTNIQIQSMFAVLQQSGGRVYLTNTAPIPATNFFDTSNPEFFNGNQTIELNGPNAWTGVPFKLKQSEFVNSNRGNSFLLMLGRAQLGTNEYQIAYVYSVYAGAYSTNIVTPVYSGEIERFTVDDKYKFNIWRKDETSTNIVNMKLSAYLASVATNSGNFYLSNVSGNLGPEAFKSEAGLFDGTGTIPLKAGEFSPVTFVLREEYFQTNNYGDCMVVFVGTGTDASNHYETAFIVQVDSPYEFGTNAKKKPEKK